MPLIEQPALWLPSWAQGFARSQSEAANPGLWNGLVGNWQPTLGPTGLTLFDVSGRGNDGTLTNMGAGGDWTVGVDGPAIKSDGATDEIGFTRLPSMGDWTCVLNADIRTNSSGFISIITQASNNNALMTIRPSLGMFVYFDAGVIKEVWTPAIGTGLHTFATQRKGTDVLGWIDGELGSTVDSTGEVFDWPNMAKLMDNWVGAIDTLIFSIAVWNRALSPNDIQKLAGNPHAIVRPMQRIWVRGADVSSSSSSSGVEASSSSSSGVEESSSSSGVGAGVGGPYCVAAKQVFHTGAAAGQAFFTGAAAGQHFHTGAEAGQKLAC